MHYTYIYIIYTYIYIADEIICSFSCHAQIKVILYRYWGFLRSQTWRLLIANMDIGTGSSPIANEGLAHPSARPMRSKTKLVSQRIFVACSYVNMYDEILTLSSSYIYNYVLYLNFLIPCWRSKSIQFQEWKKLPSWWPVVQGQNEMFRFGWENGLRNLAINIGL